MYPYNFNNHLLERSFPFNLNFSMLSSYYNPYNPYLYYFNHPHLNYNHFQENSQPNYQINNCQQNLFAQLQKPNLNQQKKIKKSKKRLTDMKFQNQIRDNSFQFKQKSRSFKYFDPSRAPSITTLRKNQQSQLDIKQSNFHRFHSLQKKPIKPTQISKLEILLSEPNHLDYPFLICKKRNSNRKIKRRYSAAYFQMRAYYINNGLQIPEQLYPNIKLKRKSQMNLNYNEYEKFNQSDDDQSSKFKQQLNEGKLEYQKIDIVKNEETIKQCYSSQKPMTMKRANFKDKK